MNTAEISIESKAARDGQLTKVTHKIEFSPEAAKSQIRHLSRHQQKILQTLYNKPGLCNQEIARFSFIPERSVSGPLSDLESMGIVGRIEPDSKSDKRKSFWRICDQQILDAMKLNDRQWVRNQ